MNENDFIDMHSSHPKDMIGDEQMFHNAHVSPPRVVEQVHASKAVDPFDTLASNESKTIDGMQCRAIDIKEINNVHVYRFVCDFLLTRCVEH